MESHELNEHLQYIVPQVKLVLVKEPGQPYSVSSPLDLEKLVEPLKHYSDEHFVSFHLDIRCRVTGYNIVSQGTVTESLIHPREVFKAALLSNAFGIIIAHNHPSGVLTPSDADISTTRTLIEGGKLLGLTIFDHVIVSSEGLYSLRASCSDLWLNNIPEDNKVDGKVIEDFWYVTELEKGLPLLIGDPDDVIRAGLIRRKQIIGLKALKQDITNLIERAISQNLDCDKELLSNFGSLGLTYIDAIINRNHAEDWLSTSSVKIDWDWLAAWKEGELAANTYSEERYQMILKAYFDNCIMSTNRPTHINLQSD